MQFLWWLRYGWLGTGEGQGKEEHDGAEGGEGGNGLGRCEDSSAWLGCELLVHGAYVAPRA